MSLLRATKINRKHIQIFLSSNVFPLPPQRNEDRDDSDDCDCAGNSLQDFVASAFPAAPSLPKEMTPLPSIEDRNKVSSAARLDFFKRIDEADRAFRSAGGLSEIYGAETWTDNADNNRFNEEVEDASELFGDVWPVVPDLPIPAEVLETMDEETEQMLVGESFSKMAEAAQKESASRRGRGEFSFLPANGNVTRSNMKEPRNLMGDTKSQRRCLIEEMDAFEPPDLTTNVVNGDGDENDDDEEESGTQPVECPVCHASASLKDVKRWGKCGICRATIDLKITTSTGKGVYRRSDAVRPASSGERVVPDPYWRSGPDRGGSDRRTSPSPTLLQDADGRNYGYMTATTETASASLSNTSKEIESLRLLMDRWRLRALEAESQVAQLRSELKLLRIEDNVEFESAHTKKGHAPFLERFSKKDSEPIEEKISGVDGREVEDSRGISTWQKVQDPDTKDWFYWNSVTGETSWDIPD
eukprot:CAMPEP_0113303306 /NCGR_PEP_ID=MMETSP0010_2-20120614/3776_1 /TAXON_ID=216773 ORGANISM="Corethron hystrix, Strain 308" /NCGR_SAMPLE_ID=MMETSP0010_2 /ASSEMBLY_ACC=CAM_ASM_000155 /LENGTH=471 /DNA_ID=CAMNT_0000157279 /DNA_START=559 /DNA_END=1974 /DNA_ORIENTATION=+ /assembly_acc=CAM_ASM_000155